MSAKWRGQPPVWFGVAAVATSCLLLSVVLLLALGIGPGHLGFEITISNSTSQTLVFRERLRAEPYLTLSDGTVPAGSSRRMGVFRHSSGGPGQWYWIGFFPDEGSVSPLAEVGLSEKEMRDLDGSTSELRVEKLGSKWAVRIVEH